MTGVTQGMHAGHFTATPNTTQQITSQHNRTQYDTKRHKPSPHTTTTSTAHSMSHTTHTPHTFHSPLAQAHSGSTTMPRVKGRSAPVGDRHQVKSSRQAAPDADVQPVCSLSMFGAVVKEKAYDDWWKRWKTHPGDVGDASTAASPQLRGL